MLLWMWSFHSCASLKLFNILIFGDLLGISMASEVMLDVDDDPSNQARIGPSGFLFRITAYQANDTQALL
jgi:hypothetical protein